MSSIEELGFHTDVTISYIYLVWWKATCHKCGYMDTEELHIYIHSTTRALVISSVSDLLQLYLGRRVWTIITCHWWIKDNVGFVTSNALFLLPMGLVSHRNKPSLGNRGIDTCTYGKETRAWVTHSLRPHKWKMVWPRLFKL